MENKKFYKTFFCLMIPMALKELISSLVNLVDTVMCGQLGESSIAAVGIGNQVFFLFTVFLFGIGSGAGVFSSQFWGNSDTKGMRKILGLNLILGVILSAVFTAAAWIFPVQIFEAFHADAETMAQGIVYLRIVSVGYIATAITSAFDYSVCASERASLPFLVRTIGLFINIFFNWIFIFGKFSFPAMGLKGAAIATVIARTSELLMMLCAVYGKKMIQAAGIRELVSVPKSLWIRFAKTSFPVVMNEVLWSVGILTYSWIFAGISPEAMVVVTIVQNIERLMLVFFHGGGNAGGVLIGKAVGAGKFEEAYLYAKRLMKLMLMTAVALAAVFIAARPLMLLPYEVSDSVYSQCMNLLMVLAGMMIIKFITFLMIVGVFRNGGDTKTAMVIDAGCVWCVGVPMVVLGGMVLHLPLIVTYSMMCAEEIVKFFVCIRHFFKKKWAKNITAEV